MVTFCRSDGSRWIDAMGTPRPASRVRSWFGPRSLSWPSLRSPCAVFCVLLAGTLGGCAAPLAEPDDTELRAEPSEFELEVLVYGHGRVLLDPKGSTYSDGTIVTLVAIDDGASFSTWGRDATGDDPIVRVHMDHDHLVVALFGDGSDPSVTFQDPVIRAADGQFLGVINDDQYDASSIASVRGPFGDDGSDTCIWNPLSTYGSDFGNLSAFFDDASLPPIVVDNREFLAFLTSGANRTPRLDPNDVARHVGRRWVARD